MAETIAAVATPPGSGARAVVRVSGPDALAAVATLLRHGAHRLASARGFSVVDVALSLGDACVPASVLVCRAPYSYTREDLLEIHLPGAPPLAGLLLRLLVSADHGASVRWARPGEFTLRAFRAGRIDLSQAEAVAQLIAATGEEEAAAGRRGLRGELGREAEALGAALLEAVALLEARLDFPDEELPEEGRAASSARLERIAERLARVRASSLLRLAQGDTLRVVLAGFPNAGKSSLLNALVERRAALTSARAGTTRDPVRVVRVHDGRRIEWVDLAGVSRLALLRDAPPGAGRGEAGAAALHAFGVEEGRERVVWEVVRRLTRLELAGADHVLWVLEPHARAERSLAEFMKLEARAKTLVVQKSDLLTAAERAAWERRPERPLLVSARARLGLDELVRRVARAPSASRRDAAAPRFLLSAHQAAALSLCAEALERAQASLAAGRGDELVAADLRDSLSALEDLTGRVTPEDILDWVFSRFCIGK